MMRAITTDKIKDAVAELCIRANLVLRKDVLDALMVSYAREGARRPKEILKAIIDNAQAAKKEKMAICQDTGMPIVFVELGRDVRVEGDLRAAINRGVEAGYRKGSFRTSIVRNPVERGRPRLSPAVIHIDLVKGDKLKLQVLIKGFGCENKSQTRMLKPTAEAGDIREFIVDAVRLAGPDACPPYIIGVGIGGTADYASLLAKKALLRRIRPAAGGFEGELLKEINKLNIGPMGLGGGATALGVNIETYPTHIAGLPVAVNISCHALRSASTVL
jgi:fumarate hydratase subunit alpha